MLLIFFILFIAIAKIKADKYNAFKLNDEVASQVRIYNTFENNEKTTGSTTTNADVQKQNLKQVNKMQNNNNNNKKTFQFINSWEQRCCSTFVNLKKFTLNPPTAIEFNGHYNKDKELVYETTVDHQTTPNFIISSSRETLRQDRLPSITFISVCECKNEINKNNKEYVITSDAIIMGEATLTLNVLSKKYNKKKLEPCSDILIAYKLPLRLVTKQCHLKKTCSQAMAIAPDVFIESKQNINNNNNFFNVHVSDIEITTTFPENIHKNSFLKIKEDIVKMHIIEQLYLHNIDYVKNAFTQLLIDKEICSPESFLSLPTRATTIATTEHKSEKDFENSLKMMLLDTQEVNNNNNNKQIFYIHCPYHYHNPNHHHNHHHNQHKSNKKTYMENCPKNTFILPILSNWVKTIPVRGPENIFVLDGFETTVVYTSAANLKKLSLQSFDLNVENCNPIFASFPIQGSVALEVDVSMLKSYRGFYKHKYCNNAQTLLNKHNANKNDVDTIDKNCYTLPLYGESKYLEPFGTIKDCILEFRGLGVIKNGLVTITHLDSTLVQPENNFEYVHHQKLGKHVWVLETIDKNKLSKSLISEGIIIEIIVQLQHDLQYELDQYQFQILQTTGLVDVLKDKIVA